MQDTEIAKEIKIGRRALLVGASLAGSIATMGMAQDAETPVEKRFREWERAQTAEDSAYTSGNTDEEVDALSDARSACEYRLMQTPSKNAKDVLYKVAAHTAFGVFGLPADNEKHALFWAEFREVLS